jgi:alkanesulfonate monooxygenase SsuD/methylene tetrahydromethanopterin reductase-like flavin-dependent oxidoreductase (luciferase family)
MKVGLSVTNQHTLDTDMVSALNDQITMVELARDRGWNSLFTGQHYLNEGNNKQLQAVPLLARLAAHSGEMTIGLSILLLNLHNPVYTAETVVTLDVIARGNFIFGVGLGYRAVEFDAFGVPKNERVKHFESYLALIQRLWTEDCVSYEGASCCLRNVRMKIRPVQRPRPPIWIAANNDPAVKRAARLGDAWFVNPHSTIDTVRRQVRRCIRPEIIANLGWKENKLTAPYFCGDSLYAESEVLEKRESKSRSAQELPPSSSFRTGSR